MAKDERRFGGSAWAVLLVGGLLIMIVGIAGQPKVGVLDLSVPTTILGIAVVLADAVWIARTS